MLWCAISFKGTMDYFILTHVWCLLNSIFKWLGIYPCQRVGNSLKNTSACSFWLRYFVMLTIIYVPILLSILYINANGISLGQILEQINDIILPKVTDKFAIMGNSLIFMVLGVVTLIKLKCMSLQMIELQEYLSRYAMLTTDGIRRLMIKCYFGLVPLILIMIASFTLTFLGIFYDLMSLLELSSFGTALIVTSSTTLSLFMMMPVIYFLLVYVEVCIVHKNWCDTLLNGKADLHLIEESRNFINGLKMISKMFSSFLFWTTSMLFFSIIVNAYVAISQFFKLSFDDMALGGMMLVTGQFSELCLLWILPLHIVQHF